MSQMSIWHKKAAQFSFFELIFFGDYKNFSCFIIIKCQEKGSHFWWGIISRTISWIYWLKPTIFASTYRFGFLLSLKRPEVLKGAWADPCPTSSKGFSKQKTVFIYLIQMFFWFREEVECLLRTRRSMSKKSWRNWVLLRPKKASVQYVRHPFGKVLWFLFEESKVPSLKCKHQFHKKCLTNWIKIKETCPMCRADVKVEEKT